MSAPIIDAELFVPCQNDLGEGIFYDSKTDLLHWVDINRVEVHTLDPITKKYSVDSYADESQFLTTVAPRASQPGFIATLSHSVVLLPEPTMPTEAVAQPKPVKRQTIKTLLEIEKGVSKPTRFNDGAADPRGRFFAGSMTVPEFKDEGRRGVVMRLDPDGNQVRILDNIGTSNGLGWSPDHTKFYYIDSLEDRISVFDYDIATGTPSNRRTFASPPPGIDGRATAGVFDGLCLDGAGNVWAARWKDQRVVGYTPAGNLIAHIRVPKCKSPTIPCFGGKDLSTMYIATAHSRLAGEGDIQAEFPNSGDLFKVEFGPGTPLGDLLGREWKGADRYRFGA
ncbi:hypothetical protein Q5752_004204 [Cryptotrichosporon argae]